MGWRGVSTPCRTGTEVATSPGLDGRDRGWLAAGASMLIYLVAVFSRHVSERIRKITGLFRCVCQEIRNLQR